MEILNILYSNNLIAVYLIGAILVVILIFIVISSMSTTPKDNKDILKDPTDEDIQSDLKKDVIEKVELTEIPEIKAEIPEIEKKEEYKEIPRINDIVENLYQKSLDTDNIQDEETKNLNTLLEEFEVPENVIDEVANEEEKHEIHIFEEPNIISETPKPEISEIEEIETPRLKENHENKENIEDMLKRLYDLRQSENQSRRNAMINEIFELKKRVDETLKANINLSELDFSYVDTKALADYYLFNEDIEFPKLK